MFSFCFVLSKTKNYEKDFLATHNACKSALLRLSSNSSMGECVCFMCVFLFVRARMIKKKTQRQKCTSSRFSECTQQMRIAIFHIPFC